MDISKQIDKELDAAKVILVAALRQKKTGARQAATKTPGKTPAKANARAARRVPLMDESQNNPDTESARALRIQTHTVKKESQRGGAAASMGEPKHSWGKTLKDKMMHDTMLRLSPKGRRGLVTAEQMQRMMNSKEFK